MSVDILGEINKYSITLKNIDYNTCNYDDILFIRKRLIHIRNQFKYSHDVILLKKILEILDLAKASEKIYKTKKQCQKIQNVKVCSDFICNGESLIISKEIMYLYDFMLKNGFICINSNHIVDVNYNFNNLNIPNDHVSRQPNYTFYTDKNYVLRTHTTTMQSMLIDIMKNNILAYPVHVFSIGKVFRVERDKNHLPCFNQIDIAMINVSYSIYDIINIFKLILSCLDINLKFRIRSSYFPFTYSSIEFDIFFNNKWIEVAGAGFISKNILLKICNNHCGIALGIGIERLLQIKYNCNSLSELLFLYE